MHHMSTPSAAVHRPRSGKAARDNKASPEDTLSGLVNIFQMLADKLRLRILLALAREGEIHVTALRQLLRQSQPAISHHLGLLRSHKLVSCRREGKKNYYSIDSSLVRELLDDFFGVAGNSQRQLHLDGFCLAFKNG
jgi:ArsR family transcriptional regulator